MVSDSAKTASGERGWGDDMARDLIETEEDIQQLRFVPLKIRLKPGDEPKVACQFWSRDGTPISKCRLCARFVRIELGGVRCRKATKGEVD